LPPVATEDEFTPVELALECEPEVALLSDSEVETAAAPDTALLLEFDVFVIGVGAGPPGFGGSGLLVAEAARGRVASDTRTASETLECEHFM
jgi:hypothetical protein